ncbi:MAG: phosphodiesterase [Firmicutes bacterium]|nr:phosphodiesterase [Bacillota bacterium]MDY4558914.1 phosphodiesterase [Eubacteriales bacterium]
MKFIIASDLHGSATSAKRIIEIANGQPLILLGDIYNHGPRNPLPDGYAPMKVAEFLNSYKGKLTVIKGNCDSEVDQMISDFTFQDYHEIVTDRSFFFSHGHKFNMDTPPAHLKKGDVCFYGHLHYPFIKEVNGVYFINSGSCSLPVNDSPLSYIILDTAADTITIYDFDGNVIDELDFKKVEKK